MEDVGRSRQQLLLHHFKELARISQEMPNGLASAGNALAKAVNLIDVQKDVQGI
jgi:excinuclease UvrABC nuclease subunit